MAMCSCDVCCTTVGRRCPHGGTRSNLKSAAKKFNMEEHRAFLGKKTMHPGTTGLAGKVGQSINTGAVSGLKKPHRFRPGTVAIREIKQQQKSTNACIPLTPFERIVREIIQDYAREVRLQPEAVKALRSAAEEYVVKKFENANLLAIHAKRSTVQVQDFRKVGRIQNETFI